MYKNISVLLFAALLCICILPVHKAAETELEVQVETSAEDGELAVNTDVTVTEAEEEEQQQPNENNNNDAETVASGEQGEMPIIVSVPEEEEAAEGIVIVDVQNEGDINDGTNSAENTSEMEINAQVQENEGGVVSGESDMNDGDGEIAVVVQQPVVIGNYTSTEVVVDAPFLPTTLDSKVIAISGIAAFGLVGLLIL